MIKNFIKTGIRSLYKNKLISFINIFGLSIAIGCCSVVYLFFEMQFTMDSDHENRENIFLLCNVVDREGDIQVWGDSPTPIGAAIKDDFPQAESVVRIVRRNGIMKYEDQVFSQRVSYTDPEFLDMFTFPLSSGEMNSLSDPSKVIISKNTADRYFGDEDPLNKIITFRSGDRIQTYTVGGVAEKFPNNSTIRFNVLINIDKLTDLDLEHDWADWSSFIAATFIQLKDPNDIGILEKGMDEYVKIQNEAEKDWPADSYIFEPLTTLSLNSQDIRGDISWGGDDIGRLVLGLIGIFMLTLACFNYINIALVSAGKRLKEIGIRKVMGGYRIQLIAQFITENLILTVLALILGIVLGASVFLPGFERLFDVGMEFDLTNPGLWMFFGGIVILTGLLSGAYPALYISSFDPVRIFRGKQQLGGRSRLSKVLIAFQFILAIITIIGGIMFSQNAEYQKYQDWGYNQKDVIGIPLAKSEDFATIRNEVSQNKDIISSTGSVNHIGRNNRLAVIEYKGEKKEVNRHDIGEDYMELMEVELTQGRAFNKEIASDMDQAVIVNETMVNTLDWDNPLEETFWFDSTRYSIIGVASDYHFNSFFDEIEPAFFRIGKEEDYDFLIVRTVEGKSEETYEYLEAKWKELFPDDPYYGFYQDQVFQWYFDEIEGHGKLMKFISVLAILLSCIGLFGLVSLQVLSRMKEFSVRKVLGADIRNLVFVINSQFRWILIAAILIGAPLGYFLIKSLMEEVYAYHMPVTVIPAITATVILIVTALLTTSSQIYKVLVNNPAETLRNE